MRRVLIGAALVGAAAITLRVLGPALGDRCRAACEGMLERMPDTAPPKRMMRSLEVIEERTGRILALLEERDASSGPPGPGA